MQVIELKKEGLDFQVKIIVPSSEVDNKVELDLLSLATTKKVAGFRPGKAPLAIIRRQYSNTIRNQTTQEQINKSLNDVIFNNNLRYAVDPVIENLVTDPGKDLEFTVKFELMPKVVMPEFKSISLEKPTLKLQEQDIQNYLTKLAESNKSYDEETKDSAIIGDQVTINAIGYIDGKMFDKGQLKNHNLILGSNAFVPGFEDQLIGSKAEDRVVVKVTFPDDYYSELASKNAEFQVEVLSVHKPHVPKVTSLFAQKFNCNTVDELKARVTNAIQLNIMESVHTRMKMHLFDQLDNMLNFEVPPSLLKEEQQILKKHIQSNTADPNINNESNNELSEYYQKLALRRVRIGLLLAEYIQEKNLKATSDDFKQAIMRQASRTPGYEQYMIDYYNKNPKSVELLRGDILEEKAIRMIFDNEILIQEKEYSLQELEKLLESEDHNHEHKDREDK